MRILLLGGTGQVGEEFRALDLPGDVEVVAPARGELDLTDGSAIATFIASQPWSAVVNAAAYTEVDKAESEERLAFVLNADAPKSLAEATARRNIPLVHISTDYVFDGKKNAPYVETDPVAPINAYARSKLAGEELVRAANPRHVILRTAWVYSPYRKNFVKTILRLAAERDRLTIVDDQLGSPTAAHDIARACFDVAKALTGPAPHYGTYHFAGKGEATWFEFAKAIVEMAAGELPRVPQIVPIKTADYPTPAKRAANTRLDCSAIVRDFGIRLRPWRESLKETIDQLMANRGKS